MIKKTAGCVRFTYTQRPAGHEVADNVDTK